jgi:peptidoglycan/LPS O-acetylase OafA/YrhL
MARLQTLQAARAFAANLVILSHLFSVEAKYTSGGVLPAFSIYGVAGVDLFFILSGFIMAALAGVSIGPSEFLWRRIVRIYPTYWLVSLAVLAVALVAPEIVNSSVSGPISLWRSFMLVPGPTVPLLAVGWTLVYEMYFYLVFAVFLAVRLPILAGLFTWAIILIVIAMAAPDQVAASPILRVVTSPLTAEFMIGVVIGTLWRNRRTPGAAVTLVIGVAGLAFSIAYLAPAVSLATSVQLDLWRVGIFGLPCAFIIYGLSGLENRHRIRLPSSFVLVGDASYAIYLSHVLVISAIGRALALSAPAGGVRTSLILIAVGLIAANLGGVVLHLLFERPALRSLHQFSRYFRSITPAPGVETAAA